MKVGIAFGLMGTGFLLLVLSGLWPKMFPATISWTPEKANRSSEIKNKLHNMAFTVNSPKPSVRPGQDLAKLKAEFEALKKENDELNAAFTSADQGPKTISKILKWSGISLAVLGVVGWYAVNQSR